jgi:hypothetical protein
MVKFSCKPTIPPPTTPTVNIFCGSKIHLIPGLGCVKDHLNKHERFALGCKLALTDGQDEENFVGTGPHSKEFIAGYNSGVAGKCPGITGDVANVSVNGA